MTITTPGYLRIHTEDPAESAAPCLQELPILEQLCRTFAQATGRRLAYDAQPVGATPAQWESEIHGVSGQSLGRLYLTDFDPASPPAGLDLPEPIAARRARQLAAAIGQVVEELQKNRFELIQREAELATAIPFSSYPEEDRQLARRFETLLRSGAEAVGAQAAGLYLLDDATSQLKLRAAWKLPPQRFLAPPRTLRGALADLEALTGHAVVLEDTTLLPHWQSPEDFPAAVCVPVSSPAVPLGTLWVFADRTRDFSATETNLLEIVAGRIASDLEREMLLRDRDVFHGLETQLIEASQRHHEELPEIPPCLDHWELAGWTAQEDRLGGEFYNWILQKNGTLSVAVGTAQGGDLAAALTASAIQAVLHAFSTRRHTAAQLMEEINRILWTGSAGERYASMFYGNIDPSRGRMHFASAGQLGAFILRPYGWEPIVQVKTPVGAAGETRYPQQRQVLAVGDVLVVVTDRADLAWRQGERYLGQAGIAERLLNLMHLPAQEMIDRVCKRLVSDEPNAGRTILVVKRRK